MRASRHGDATHPLRAFLDVAAALHGDVDVWTTQDVRRFGRKARSNPLIGGEWSTDGGFVDRRRPVDRGSVDRHRP